MLSRPRCSTGCPTSTASCTHWATATPTTRPRTACPASRAAWGCSSGTRPTSTTTRSTCTSADSSGPTRTFLNFSDGNRNRMFLQKYFFKSSNMIRLVSIHISNRQSHQFTDHRRILVQRRQEVQHDTLPPGVCCVGDRVRH